MRARSAAPWSGGCRTPDPAHGRRLPRRNAGRRPGSHAIGKAWGHVAGGSPSPKSASSDPGVQPGQGRRLDRSKGRRAVPRGRQERKGREERPPSRHRRRLAFRLPQPERDKRAVSTQVRRVAAVNPQGRRSYVHRTGRPAAHHHHHCSDRVSSRFAAQLRLAVALALAPCLAEIIGPLARVSGSRLHGPARLTPVETWRGGALHRALTAAAMLVPAALAVSLAWRDSDCSE